MGTLKTAMSILDTTLFEIGGTPISVATLIIAALIVFVTLLVSRLAQRGLRRWLAARGVTDEGSVAVTGRLLHYLLLFVGFGIAVRTVGINLSALFAAGAFFAVGLGFAMQNIAQNFVSGVILLVERAITPGDVLQVDGRVVKVLRMGIRATIARTRDGEDVIVPNSVLVQSIVQNFTLDDAAYRVRTQVGVTYDSDLRLVREVLEVVAGRIKTDLPMYQPQVLLLGFGNSSVDFEVAIWMDDPWWARIKLSELNEAIWWAFKERGIVIAFPQVDVHFDPPVVDSISRLTPVRTHSAHE
ncbi:MAG: mechanosensitive ion channel [Myxococcales bacterium]|nr:mechanosensitive ion channel [Myxococcales bacterium]